MQIADLFYSIRGEGFEQLESKINTVSKKFSAVGEGLTNNVTKPIVGIATDIINTTMTFDQEMSKVKAVTGETGKGFDTLRDLALDMGSNTSKSATEAAEAISYMGLAGWDLTQIQQGLEPVLRASEAGFMDLGTTSDLVTDSMSALGIGTEDLGRYLDIAAKAQNTSNQSMEQFLNAMVTAGGTFKMFNIPLEESGALLGILANRGFKGSEAGNALTSVFANLTSGTGQAGKAMKDLGIEVYDGNGKFRGATTILKELNGKFDGMTEAQRNTYIQMIGGKTRTKELNALLNGTKDELDGLTDGLYNSDGALSEMAATMKDNFAGQITSIKSKLEGIAISIGDRLTPYLKIAAEWIQKLADWFYKLPVPVKDVIIIVGLVAAAIGPLLLLFAGVVSAIGFVAGAFSTVATVISSIGAPVAIAVVAIVGIVTALGALLLSSEEVRNGLKEKFQDIFNKIKDVAGWIKEHIEDIKGTFKGLFQGLTTGNFGDFINNMKNLVPSETMTKIHKVVVSFVEFRDKIIEIRDAIIEFGSKVNAIISPIFNMLKDAILGLDFSSMLTSFQGLYQAIQPLLPILQGLGVIIGTVIVSAIGILYSAISGIISAIPNLIGIITSAVGIIVGIISTIINAIVAIFSGDSQLVLDSLTSLWENIKNLFINAGLAIWNIVKGFITGLISFFTNLYQVLVGGSIIPDMINAIVRWFISLPGKILGIIASFVSNIISKFNSLKSSVINVFNNLKSSALSVWNNIKSTISGIASNIMSVVVSKFNSLRSSISSILSSIRSVFSSIWNSIRSTVSSIVSSVVSAVSSRLSSLRSSVSSALSSVRSTFVSIWNGIKSTVVSIVSGMVSTIKGLISGISGVISTISDKIGGLISKAKSAKSLIPGFAGGVRNFAGGWAMVGEQGPELMYVPHGSDIYSNSQSKNMLNNATPSKMITSGSNQENVNLYGDIVIDAKSVEEFSDIVSLLKGVKHYKNMR